MHLKRQQATTKLPIRRKGTTFVARPLSHLNDSVSVVAALRDMLNLANNTKEVKKMIHSRLLKLNGRPIKDHKESIQLFNLLEADKTYFLSILPTKRFTFIEAKSKDKRVCRVSSRRLVGSNKLQLNLHDGTNLLSDKKDILPGDSVYLDSKNKIVSHVSLSKGKSVMVISGKHTGKEGKIESRVGNKLQIKFGDNSSVELHKKGVIAL